MKKMLLSTAALCCFVSAQAQWTTGTNIENTNSGDVRVKSRLIIGPSSGGQGTLEWLTSTYGAGYGHKIYNLDTQDGTGIVYLRIATRGNSTTWSDMVSFGTNGCMGVGYNTPVYRLHLPNNGNESGRGLANAWLTYSSGRWKENVKTLEKASEKIMALRGVEYDLKKENGGGHTLGFIAEEAGKVLPEAVSWEADGKNALGMNYDAVVPVLVEAFKQLSREKKALEDRLTKLEKDAPSRARLGASGAASETSAVLRQNRPNPFGEKTVIEFVLPESAKQAALFIYDLQGKQLKRIEIADKRSQSVELGGNSLPAAGLYLYSLIVDGKVMDTKQMVLTK